MKGTGGEAARLARAIGVGEGDLADALRALVGSLGLPATLAGAAYRITDQARLVDDMVKSHFNRTSPYAPTADDYRAILADIAA